MGFSFGGGDWIVSKADLASIKCRHEMGFVQNLRLHTVYDTEFQFLSVLPSFSSFF